MSLVLFGALSLAAPTPEHSLSIDSRYVSRYNSNESVGNFGLEFFDAQHFLFELANRRVETPFGRGLTLLGYYLYSITFNPGSSWMFSFHEYGHGGRDIALGLPPTYVPGDLDGRFSTDPSVGYETFLPFFIYNVGHQVDFGATYRNSGGTSAEEDAIASMAGVNNSSYFAELIEERLLRKRASFLFYFPYVVSMLDAYSYSLTSEASGASSGDDIASILSYYNSVGISATHATLRGGARAALYFNPMLYYFFYSAFRFVAYGEAVTARPQIGKFLLPRLHQYFTSRGMTLKLIAGWTANRDWTLGFSIEHVYVGNSGNELGLQVIRKISENWEAEAKAYFGINLIGGVQGNYHKGAWTFSGGVETLHPNSFYGERNSLQMGKDQYSLNAWSRIAFNY